MRPDEGLNGAGPAPSRPMPCVIDFESFCIPEEWAAMRFDWNAAAGKWSFYLDRDIPYVIGFNVRKPLERLLERNGLDFSAIRHWVLHTGGGADLRARRRVTDAVLDQVERQPVQVVPNAWYDRRPGVDRQLVVLGHRPELGGRL